MKSWCPNHIIETRTSAVKDYSHISFTLRYSEKTDQTGYRAGLDTSALNKNVQLLGNLLPNLWVGLKRLLLSVFGELISDIDGMAVPCPATALLWPTPEEKS
jgi:hypothetical protein